MEKCKGLGRLSGLWGGPAPHYPAVPFGFKGKLRPRAKLPEVAASPVAQDPVLVSAAPPPHILHTSQPSRKKGEALG